MVGTIFLDRYFKVFIAFVLMQLFFTPPTFSSEEKGAYHSGDIIDFIKSSPKILIHYELCDYEAKVCEIQEKGKRFYLFLEPKNKLLNQYNTFFEKGPNPEKFRYIHSISKGSSSDGKLIEQTFQVLSEKNKKKIQKTLSANQFYKGKIDGLWGKGTSEAIRKYVNYKGIPYQSGNVDLTFKIFDSLLDKKKPKLKELILELSKVEIPSSIVSIYTLSRTKKDAFRLGRQASKGCKKNNRCKLNSTEYLIFSDGRMLLFHSSRRNPKKIGTENYTSELAYSCTDILGLYKNFELPLCSSHNPKDPSHGKINKPLMGKITSIYDIEKDEYFPLDLKQGWPLVAKSTKPKSTNNNPSIKKISPLPKTAEKGGIKTEEKTGLKKIGSGTGFYVSDEGYIATNNHVISKCQKVMANGEKLLLVDKNQKLDLAILKSESKTKSFARFTKSPAKPGDDIIVLGYPFGNDTGQATITKGIVSSTKGPNNDKTLLQVDASIQPGNSGGPTIDRNGALVGITVATANTNYYFKKFGHIPQNMNFSIKSKYLTSLLDLNDINYQFSDTKTELRASEIFETVNPSVVLLECWGF